MHADEKRNAIKRNASKDRIDCVLCVFAYCVHELHISVFWLRCKLCVGCIACVEYDSLETACRHMKMDLKVGFQAAAPNATHEGHATQSKNNNARNACTWKTLQKMHTGIESIACVAFFACVHCIFQYFDCVANCASVALRVLHTTAWKPHVGRPVSRPVWVTYSCLHFCDESVYQRSQMQRTNEWLRDEQLCNSYAPVVCQFSWSPQRDMSSLWPVIKLQGDLTSDHQTVTLDSGGRNPAWPVVMLLLGSFVIGLGCFWNSRKTVT